MALCRDCHTVIPCHCHLVQNTDRAAVVSPPTDRAALRDRIAGALLARIKQATVSKTQPFDAVTALLAPTEFDLADAVLAVLPEPPSRAESVCICGHPERQHFEDVCITEITGCHCGDFLPVEAAAEEIARLREIVRQKPPSRAAVLLWAADKLDESERLRDLTDDHMRDVHAAADELRRLAAEAQQQPETEACGRTESVCGTEYPPCARPAGHEEAYCRTADGNRYFLAVGYRQPATANSSAPLWSEETRCVCGHLPGIHTGAVRFCAVPECDCASYAPPV